MPHHAQARGEAAAAELSRAVSSERAAHREEVERLLSELQRYRQQVRRGAAEARVAGPVAPHGATCHLLGARPGQAAQKMPLFAASLPVTCALRPPSAPRARLPQVSELQLAESAARAAAKVEGTAAAASGRQLAQAQKQTAADVTRANADAARLRETVRCVPVSQPAARPARPFQERGSAQRASNSLRMCAPPTGRFPVSYVYTTPLIYLPAGSLRRRRSRAPACWTPRRRSWPPRSPRPRRSAPWRTRRGRRRSSSARWRGGRRRCSERRRRASGGR